MEKNELEEYTAYSGGWISFRFREEVTDAYIHRLEGDYFYLPCRQNPEKPFSPTAGRT